jgi:hypothetical protein
MLIDPISQPEQKDWKFIKELSEPVNFHFNWTRSSINSNEADLSRGVSIKIDFPDPEHRLETAYEDLDNFFVDSGLITNGDYKIIIQKIDTECFESYRLDICENSCKIQANDSEGIRRGIYYLEDLLLGADGPFLKLGFIERKPWIKKRISRCFWGPIKRPPLNRDELMDDVDYYPDEYLNRLAHEGVNGLWFTIAFSDLCKTSITKLDPNAEKRLKKLRRTVKKCLRYGIKTYIFSIEPRGMAPDNPFFLNNPELRGSKSWDENYCFCPFSDIAQKYLYDSTNWIFSQVPDLGGMINMSFGERATTCLSYNFGKDCPVCSKKAPGEIIAASLKPMEQGMHAASPEADFISWLYVAKNGTGDTSDTTLQMLDIAERLPENITLQYNFESGGNKEQLGKERHAGDYWLSYTGPSNIFSQISQKVLSRRNNISAKIQVCCSHELATVPFIPAPPLLYRKYWKMHKLGVSSVMQCWYFGNYPGIMNKTAGELAFEEFKDSEYDFLLRLATPEWGEHAKKIVEAWELFAEGYSNYPLDNMFQYYGPMHDGVVWPLYLIPVNKPLAPTWRLDYGTSGDRYGECLGTFSLDEVLTLCQIISEKWSKGAKIMQDLRPAFHNNPERLKDIDLVEALGILFESGYNIFKFYDLREILLNSNPNKWSDALIQMENIVNGEIKRSSRMIELCEADSRLGFHSEAEGYKFFPDKLKWRIDQLKNLLKNDFTMIKDKINDKHNPFIDKITKTYVCNSGKMEKVKDFTWRADYSGEKLKISVCNLSSSDQDDFRIYLEPKAFHPPITIAFKGSMDVDIPLSTVNNYIRFNIIKESGNNNDEPCKAWVKFTPLKLRLNLGHYNPQAMGKLILYQPK